MACPSDWLTHSKTTFAGSSFLLYEGYDDAECSGSASSAFAFKTNECVAVTDGLSFKSTVTDGAISVSAYGSADCTDGLDSTISATSDQLSAGSCANGYKFNIENGGASSNSAASVFGGKVAASAVAVAVGVFAAAEYLQ